MEGLRLPEQATGKLPPGAAQAANGASASATSSNTESVGTAAAAGSSPAQAPITGGTALGHAVWLMMKMPNYRHVFLSDLEWMLLPQMAVATGAALRTALELLPQISFRRIPT